MRTRESMCSLICPGRTFEQMPQSWHPLFNCKSVGGLCRRACRGLSYPHALTVVAYPIPMPILAWKLLPQQILAYPLKTKTGVIRMFFMEAGFIPCAAEVTRCPFNEQKRAKCTLSKGRGHTTYRMCCYYSSEAGLLNSQKQREYSGALEMFFSIRVLPLLVHKFGVSTFTCTNHSAACTMG